MLQASLSKVTGHCRQKIYKMQTQLTTEQIKSLEDKIYQTLILLPYYDEDGEVMERGMGEMGETRDEAERIVWEWMEENNITEA